MCLPSYSAPLHSARTTASKGMLRARVRQHNPFSRFFIFSFECAESHFSFVFHDFSYLRGLLGKIFWIFFGYCVRFFLALSRLTRLNLWTSIDSETMATEGFGNGTDATMLPHDVGIAPAVCREISGRSIDFDQTACYLVSTRPNFDGLCGFR